VSPVPEPPVKLDVARRERIGLDEAVFCSGKLPEHLTAVLDQAAQGGNSLLLTRLSPDRLRALPQHHRDAIDYDELSRTGFFGAAAATGTTPRVAVVTAGTSDATVAAEVQRTLSYHGERCLEVHDAGVAGLWRLLDRVEEIAAMDVVIAVAGMEAALVSVLGGLVPGAVIAVPTSVGYGVAEGGRAALHAALGSCAPGVVVVNIDNGYGAACAALRILRAAR
jgi:NCAIR mutase (PurE)-related protein